MKKRILALLICFFSVFTLCGCGSISYVLQIDSASGVVTQGVVFSVSKTDIQNAGKTVINFKQHVEYVANTVVSNSYTSFENSHEMDEQLLTYDGTTATFAEIVLWTESHIDPQTRRPQIIWEENGDTLKCSISLRFLSIYSYLYFHDSFPDDEDEDNVIWEQHLFYAKKITEQTSPFANLDNNDIVDYFVDYFDGNFSASDMTYSFMYSTPDSKMHSDADSIKTTSSGNYVHIWNWTASQLEQSGGKFHTYTIKIKTPTWYWFGLSVGLFTALVLTIVCKRKEKMELSKKQTENNMQQNQDEN